MQQQAYERVARSRTLLPDLLVVLDEAANTPTRWLPQVASTCSGLGMLLVTISQSKAQIDGAYGVMSDSVLTNHGTKLIFTGVSDAATLRYATELLGDEEVLQRGASLDVVGGGRSMNESTTRMRLLPGDVLRRARPLDDHEHDGAVLRGIWEGRPFRAVTYRTSGTQYSASVGMYKVTMTSERRGPAWQVIRISEGKSYRKEAAWRSQTDRSSTEKRLVDAGVLGAIEEADAPVRHLHNDVTMSYDPRDNEVVYQDSSGDVPSAEDFVAHLNLVRRLVDINGVASESAAEVDDESRNASGTLRLRLRVGSPPVWTMCLWLPASIVGVTFSDSWPWTLALLSIALITPLAWRIRIGRR